jgi:hypothetical protein
MRFHIIASAMYCFINCQTNGYGADINEDQNVNVTDLLTLINQWRLVNTPADINQDGIVDVSDLLILVGS